MNRDEIEKAVRLLLSGLGEDLSRPGLRYTPRRVACMYEEILSGKDARPEKILQVLHGEQHDEMVLVRDIPFSSICEHHLLPFMGVAHVAYIPDGGRITGLSKLARVVDSEAKKLQLQERLTTDIADIIMRILKPLGVIVVMEAEHLCMTMRGVKKPGALTVTSAVRGIFRDNPATRAEATALIYGKRSPA